MNGSNGNLAGALEEADMYFSGVGQMAEMQISDGGYTASPVTANMGQGVMATGGGFGGGNAHGNGGQDDLLML